MDRIDRQHIGKTGEELACKYLKRQGYAIIERNFRLKIGEIDIIAEKGGTVHFIEVKSSISRENSSFDPVEHADRRKLAKVAKTASVYMERAKDTRAVQVDVLGVYINFETRRARCVLFEQEL